MRSSYVAVAITSLFAVVITGTPAAAGEPGTTPSDWPQYLHGPYHQSFAQSETTLTTGNVTSLMVGWSQKITRSGYAPNSGGPIVVGNTVYVGGGDVRAYNATTGALLWHNRLGGAVLTTPAYANGLVVVGTYAKPAAVVALNASTGAVVWRHRVGVPISASPTIAGRTVYVSVDNVGVIALRRETGTVRWVWHTNDADTFPLISSPTTDGKTVLVNDAGGAVAVALDAKTGAPLWQQTLATGEGASMDNFTIALMKGVAYVPTIDGDVVALDEATGAIRWRTSLGSAVFRSIVLDAGHVLATTENAHVTSLDPSTGAIQWAYTAAQLISPAIAIANGVAYVGTARDDHGTLGPQLDFLDMSNGTRIGAIPLVGGYPPMDPAISNGRVYVAHWYHLVELRLP